MRDVIKAGEVPMSNTNPDTILIGGFTETDKSLVPVAKALLAHDFAKEVRVVQQLDGVLKPEILDTDENYPESSIEGLTVVTHSDGIRHLLPEHKPKEVYVFAGTEPMELSTAKKRMAKKIGWHALNIWRPRNAVMSYQSVKSVARNFKTSKEAAYEIIDFSMKEHLTQFVDAGIPVYAILSHKDEFHQPTDEYRQELEDAGIQTEVIPLRHDALLMKPHYTVGTIRHFDTRRQAIAGPQALEI